MNSSSGFAESAFENGFYICKYDRCGRKFDSEIRMRDHQIRMHDRDPTQQTQQTQQPQRVSVQAEMNLSNGSNMYKKEEQLKLPTINNGSQILSSTQRTPTVNQKFTEKSDQLHPVIRQAQQITNVNNGSGIMQNNSGNYSHQKKQSMNSSIVKNSNSQIGSRPTSSSSSNFNTTSSSTNNVEFGGMKESNIMKNSFLENSQVQKQQHTISSSHIQQEQGKATFDKSVQLNGKTSQIVEKQQQINIKQTNNSNVSSVPVNTTLLRRNNSQSSIQNTSKPPSATNREQKQNPESIVSNLTVRSKVAEIKPKTKEEILFGKKNIEGNRLVIQKGEKPKQKQEKAVTSKSKKVKNNDFEDDDDEEDIEKQINQEDQILNMQFSDDDNEEERNNDEGNIEEDNKEDEDYGDEDNDQEFNNNDEQQIVKGMDKIKSRPSPAKDSKAKGINTNEKIDRNIKNDVEKRRVSFAHKEIDLEKEKENAELTKISEVDTKKVLCSKFILEYTGSEKLEEVEQLFLRKKNLLYLSDSDDLDWSEFMNLQMLVIAHNPLLEKIEAISSIPNHNLISLNLEYNNISDITPIFHHTQLQVLYLSGNKIPSIKGINKLSQLQTLSLMKNQIKGFDTTLDTLCQLSKLEELELEQNPVSSRFNYKYDILWKLKLKKLDGEEITELDMELSKTFQKEFLNQVKEKAGLPTRPGTAKDWGSRSTFTDSGSNNNNNKSYKERFKQKLNDLVQESKEVLNCIPEDKIYELETELELAKQQEDQLEAELEVLYLEQNELREKKDKLVVQNEEFTQSITEFQQLQQQKNQLSQKYRTYLDFLKNNDSEGASFIKEIFKLNLKLEDLQKENTELVIENNVLQQTKSKFFSASERPQSANKNMKSSKADFKKSLVMFNQIEQNIKSQMTSIQQQPHNLRTSTVAANTKYNNQVYDDAEEVLSQDENESEDINEEEQKQANQSDQNKINKKDGKTENKLTGGVLENNDSEVSEGEEEYNPNDLDLDIGFDSDDLDEDMKEIKDLLKKNDDALKGVKHDINDF